MSVPPVSPPSIPQFAIRLRTILTVTPAVARLQGVFHLAVMVQNLV